MRRAPSFLVGFGAGVALFLALTIAVAIRTASLQNGQQWVEHTHEVIESLDALALDSALPRAREIEALVADNPPQHEKAIEVRRLIEERAPSPAILRIVAAMNTEEHRLLRERIERQNRALRLSRGLFGTGLFFSLALMSVAVWRVSYDLSNRRASERKLAAKDEQYRHVVELAGDIIYRTDERGRFIFCNRAAFSTLHFDPAIMGTSYLEIVRADKRKAVERFYRRQFAVKKESTYLEFPIVDGQGRERWIGQNVQIVIEDGKRAGFQGIVRDVTSRKQAELELQKSRNFVERIAATTPGILYVYDLREQKNVFINREIINVLGYQPEHLRGFDPLLKDIVHPDDETMLRGHYAAMREAADGEIRRLEYRARHADGHWVWLSGRETPFERGADGLVVQVVGIAQDTTARKAVQEKLAYQANYDALTGLPNRHFFWTKLQAILRRTSIDQTQITLCLFDVDRFKSVNDRFGHAAGDEVLEAVGNVVRAELRPMDIAARLGGDEFCFILPATGADEGARAAERIAKRLSTLAFGIETGSPFSVTATFGVAESRAGIETKELMEAADRALYRAKAEGRNRVCIEAGTRGVSRVPSQIGG